MEQKATPVLVTLTSSAHSEGGDQDTPIRLRCQGQLKQTASGFMLRYQEIQTDDETGKTVSRGFRGRIRAAPAGCPGG